MESNKLSFFSGSMLWFGAAISIAEISTGALLAPLGLWPGITAIFIGHIIGCILFYLAGLIGANSRKSAMETVGLSFGRYGSIFFSTLNVLQLLGWTAVMIYIGADAFGSAVNDRAGITNNSIWCIIIGILIIIWIAVGIKNVGKLNNISVVALFVLMAILSVLIFQGGEATPASKEDMSFGLALELSIAMPISWLPLISDYTRHTDKPKRFTLVSTLSYFFGSCLMYLIGLGAAIFVGNSDIVPILMKAGLGIAAMLIVILSTVTTTYLDVFSTAESIRNIKPKWDSKPIGITVCAIGTMIAIFIPITLYEDFLYMIGSVFVPMAVILICDYFILHKREVTKQRSIVNISLWVIGFIIYRVFLGVNTILGSTIPVIVLILILSIVTNYLLKRMGKKNV